MADVKISALPASTTPLAGTEVLPVVQSGATKKVSVDDLTAGRAVSALSLTATNLKTSPTTANLDISGNSIAASGSNTDIDINITPKGAGKVTLGGVADNLVSSLTRSGLAAYENYELVRFSAPTATNVFSTFSGAVSVEFLADRATSVNECSIRAVNALVTLGAYQEGSSSANLRANVTVMASHRLEYGTGSQGTLDVALVCEGSTNNGATWTALTSSTGINSATGTVLMRIRANLTGTLPFQFSRIRSASSISGLITSGLTIVSDTITPI